MENGTHKLSGGSRKHGKTTDSSPLGPVPFQGIGTRLRRSRSKDHSNEFDNLATSHHHSANGPGVAMEIASLRNSLAQQQQQHHLLSRNNNPSAYEHSSSFGANNNNYSKGTGTLERPKRLMYSSNNTNSNFPTLESSTFISQPLYGTNRNIYEETKLLGHQYEEPHLVMDRGIFYINFFY